MGVVSLSVVYASIEKGEAAEKYGFYDKLSSLLDPCSSGYTHCLCDFSATTVIGRTRCELYVGPQGFGNKDDNSARLLNFSRFIEIPGSFYQRSELHFSTSYRNVGGYKRYRSHLR